MRRVFLVSLMVVATVLGVGLVAIDAAARRGGVYDLTALPWPALYRVHRAGPADADAPYRESRPTSHLLVVPEGIPRAASVMLLPAGLLSLAWTLCVVLALGDVPAALGGTRGLVPTLASLALCVVRAGAGWASLAAALGQRRGAFAAIVLVTLGLDATLALFPIPCSDNRASDVRVALAGLLIDVPLALGFAWSQWERRGLIPEHRPAATDTRLN